MKELIRKNKKTFLVDSDNIEKMRMAVKGLNEFLSTLPATSTACGYEPTEDVLKGILSKGENYVTERVRTDSLNALKAIGIPQWQAETITEQTASKIPAYFTKACADARAHYSELIKEFAIRPKMEDIEFKNGCLRLKDSFMEDFEKLHTIELRNDHIELAQDLLDVAMRLKEIESKGLFTRDSREGKGVLSLLVESDSPDLDFVLLRMEDMMRKHMLFITNK